MRRRIIPRFSSAFILILLLFPFERLETKEKQARTSIRQTLNVEEKEISGEKNKKFFKEKESNAENDNTVKKGKEAEEKMIWLRFIDLILPLGLVNLFQGNYWPSIFAVIFSVSGAIAFRSLLASAYGSDPGDNNSEIGTTTVIFSLLSGISFLGYFISVIASLHEPSKNESISTISQNSGFFLGTDFKSNIRLEYTFRF